MRFGVGRAIVLQISRSGVRQAQSPLSLPKLSLAFASAAIVNHIGQYGTLSLEQSMLDSKSAFLVIWGIIAMIPFRRYHPDRVICIASAQSLSLPVGKHNQVVCYGGDG